MPIRKMVRLVLKPSKVYCRNISMKESCMEIVATPIARLTRTVTIIQLRSHILHFSDAFRAQDWVTERGTSSARWRVQTPPSAIFFGLVWPHNTYIYVCVCVCVCVLVWIFCLPAISNYFWSVKSSFHPSWQTLYIYS